MEILESKSKAIYNIEIKGTKKEERLLCPICSDTRKNTKDKCLSWNNVDKVGFCHHCEGSFVLYSNDQKTSIQAITWENKTKLSEKWVKYLGDRRISQKVIIQMGLAVSSKWLQFPFYDGDQVINIKSRDFDKNFRLESGKPLIFYNLNALKKYDEIIITEGEIDALSFMECGYDNVISVPNGANTGKMDYLESAMHILDEKKKVYLAVDNDSKGLELRNEFLRRIGFDKCLIIDFGKHKDANEFLMEKGGLRFPDLFINAKEPTIEGIAYADDFFDDVKDLMENGLQSGKTIGIPQIDELITWETRRLALCTGIPSHGKSELIDFITVRLFQEHNWRCAYFTPENYPLQYHYSKLYSKINGCAFNMEEYDATTFTGTHEIIKNNFFWIQPKNDITIESIIERAKFLVKSKGIKILVIDPYNKLEHNHGKNLSETLYISSFLDKLTNFAKLYNVLVILIAHPTKMPKQKDGTYSVPGLYDISGSSNFYNKTDYGFTVYRKYDFKKSKLSNEVQLYVKKVKFKHLGSTGVAELEYNYKNGIYS